MLATLAVAPVRASCTYAAVFVHYSLVKGACEPVVLKSVRASRVKERACQSW